MGVVDESKGNRKDPRVLCIHRPSAGSGLGSDVAFHLKLGRVDVEVVGVDESVGVGFDAVADVGEEGLAIGATFLLLPLLDPRHEVAKVVDLGDGHELC